MILHRFCCPNQYVNYSADSQAVKKAAELTKGKKNDLEKITAIYDFTVKTLTMIRRKRRQCQSGYLPNVDQVLASKTEFALTMRH